MTTAGVTTSPDTSTGASAPTGGARPPAAGGIGAQSADVEDAVRALGPRPAQPSCVRPAVTGLLTQPAGLGLLAAIEALTASGPGALTAAEQVDLVAAIHSCTHHLDALALDATAALTVTIYDDARRQAEAGAGGSQGGDRWSQVGGAVAVANHLAPALRVSPSTASKEVALARVATRDVPTALTAMREGVMSAAQLRALIAATRTSCDAIRTAAEAAAIRWATSCTWQQMATRLTQLVAQLDPDAHAAAVEDGLSRCDVRLGRSPYAGCARMVADLPVIDGYAAFTVVDAMARRAAGAAGASGDGGTSGDGGAGRDERTLGRLRADALTGLVTSAGIRDVPSREELDADLVEVDVVTTERASDASADDESGPDDPGGPADSGGSGGAGGAPQPAGWVRPPGWTPPAPLALLTDLDQVRRVVVRVPWATVTGEGAHPGHLAGHGPLDAASIHRLAEVAPFRWLHADPTTGHLIHREARLHPPPRPSPTARGPWKTARSGWTSNPPEPPPLPEVITSAIRQAGYVPGALLRAHVETRDGTCIGPACHQPARTAGGIQLDHTIEHARGGVTTAANLGCVCRRDHQAKTHGQWQLVQDRAGVFTWTSPHGRVYTRAATPLIPDWSETGGPTQR